LQVVWETNFSAADESVLQDAMLQRLAEKETGFYGTSGLLRPDAVAKGAATGAVRLTTQISLCEKASLE